MNRILRGSVSLAILLGLPGLVHADVVREEPNPDTVNQSDVIAVATVLSVQGKGPFTHQAPPKKVTFKVEKAIKGCVPGDKLPVRNWTTKGKPVKEMLPQPIYEGDLIGWKKSPVKIPATGTPTLLFLKKSKQGPFTQTPNGFGVPIWFENPSEETLVATRGLMTLEVSLKLTNERFNSSEPISVRGTVKNISAETQTLDPGQVVARRLNTPSQQFMRGMMGKPDSGRLPPPIVLKAGEKQDFEWDLRRLVSVPMTVPGNYSVNLQIPALCNGVGILADFQFDVEGKSGLLDAVRQAGIVFTAVTGEVIPQPSGGTDVVLKDRFYLKGGKRTAEIPHQVHWLESLPLPKPGDRLILCFGDEPGPRLVYAEPENYENLAEVKKILFSS